MGSDVPPLGVSRSVRVCSWIGKGIPDKKNGGE